MNKQLFVVLFAFAITGCQSIPTAKSSEGVNAINSFSWFSIPAPDRPIPLKFLRSKADGKSPTVFLVHGTNGPDARQEHWARYFNDRGYNALIVDFKTGRFTGPQDRANLYPYPLIDRAHAWLIQQPSVDPSNVVWMGFSLGSALGLMTEQGPWSSFVLFYPSCWSFTKTQQPKPPRYWAYHAEKPREKPTLIVWGKADEYGEGMYCPEMLKLMSGPVDSLAIENAHHGFDGNISASFNDSSSPTGSASLRPDATARRAAEIKVGNFLKINKSQ